MSFAILVIGCLFYLRMSIYTWRARFVLIPIVPAILMGIAALGSIAFGNIMAGVAASAVFNGVLGGLSVFAARRSRTSPDARSRFAGFLWFTAVVYFIVLIANLVVPAIRIPAVFGVLLLIFSTGAFALVWGVSLGVLGLKWLGAGLAGRPPGDSPAGLVRDFGVSPRESQLLSETVRGKSSTAIAAELFISTRTVETHLQNIYQKCGVTGRVELTNLHNRYRSRTT
jgi:DNA-binding CsgD family transcriptional regulator